MPTVRLTKKLIKSILDNSNTFLTTQRRELPELSTKEANHIVNNFVEHFNLQPHKADFLNSRIEFLNINNFVLSNNKKSEILVMITPIKLFVPEPLFAGSSTLCLDFDNINYDFPMEDLQLIEINMEQRYNIIEQCNDFETQIEKLLARCTTIKQFIEAWPQGEQFIPSFDLQKHYEQEKKIRKRGVYLEEEELTNLNSLLLTSKIT